MVCERGWRGEHLSGEYAKLISIYRNARAPADGGGEQILSDAGPERSLQRGGALRPADEKNRWQLV